MSEEKKSSKGGTGEIWVHKFTEDSAAHFREQVLSIALKDSDYPIIIYIDSYGGSVDALAKMIDTLEQIENPIVTVCMGKAMSCGAILLSHGHVRYCAPNSRVLVHEVSGGVGLGDVHNQFNDAVEVKRLNVHFSGLLAHNCGIKSGYEGLRKVIKQRDGRDIWMNPKEALKFGLVDIIGTPVVHPLVAYQMFAVKAPPRTDRIKRARLILGLDRKMPK